MHNVMHNTADGDISVLIRERQFREGALASPISWKLRKYAMLKYISEIG